MTTFYDAPDNTTDSASQYKTNIDNSLAVHHRVAGGLQVAAQSSPNMTVRYTAGSIQNGTTLTEVATGSTGTITAPSGNPRIDRVVVDQTSGAISVVTGAESATPSAPAIPVGKIALAKITLATSTTQITNSLITDERPAIVATSSAGSSLDIAGTTAETSADNADSLLIYDDSAGANREMTRANFLAGQAVTNLDINGATSLGAAPADDDKLIIYDDDAAANKEVSVAELKQALGAPVLLQTQTASSSSEIAFDSTKITSSYTHYRIVVEHVVPATDGQGLYLKVSDDNGSTYKEGASSYIQAGDSQGSTSTYGTNESTGTTHIDLSGTECGSGTREMSSYVIEVFGPNESGEITSFNWQETSRPSNGEVMLSHGAAVYDGTEQINNIKLYFSSGNIASGRFHLWGMA